MSDMSMVGSPEGAPYRIINDPKTGRRYRVGEDAKSLIGVSRWAPIMASWSCMFMAGVLEYAWGAFSGSLESQHHWSISGVFWIFSIYIVFESCISHPLTSYLREHRGVPVRWLVTVGGVLCGIVALAITAFASSLWEAYIGYAALGGFGSGIIYNSCVSMSAKWYPDKSGWRTGFVDGGWAYGAVPWIVAIGFLEGSSGTLGDFTRTMLLIVGACITVIIVAAAQFMKDPPKDWWPKEVDPINFQRSKSARSMKANPPAVMQCTPREMWRTPQAKWVVLQYLCFVASSLFGVAYYFPFGEAMSLGAVVVVAGGAGFSLADGIGRALFGYLGDMFGRRRVMLYAYFFGFIIQMLVLMSGLLGLAAGFAIFAVLSGLLSGVGFALTATIVPDYWGTNNNAQNYATVYSFKTVGGIVAGGVAALVITGGFAQAEGQPHWLRGFILGSALLAIGFLILLLKVTRPTVEQMESARAGARAAELRRRERKGLPPEPRDEDEPVDPGTVDTATGDTSLRH